MIKVTAFESCGKCGGYLGFERRVIDGCSYHPNCAPIDWAAIRAETAADLEHERIYGVGGLRDQIAIAALAGSIAFPTAGQEKIPENAAKWAYVYADAMLEARKAKP